MNFEAENMEGELEQLIWNHILPLQIPAGILTDEGDTWGHFKVNGKKMEGLWAQLELRAHECVSSDSG
ncbi:hypothetical protein PUNSTDRAFT_128872 [Punctularia strigosozonata HHB-11173 SS5]|uniref:uncharacterized protein n=1 Tax=Punctularia strigosozonata (strain HHB-11173) TaxID=741275 RepID=UPI000441859F|nr:uncharacterized protein PUNSTDRAFT_128872 [Punctularia strigosozonata HHB-11173 SS5]EIN13184.1 hypothetical protein PUNSTDRAFT_128872 [Punctularia strigosozonata HHB-11173 SS5]